MNAVQPRVTCLRGDVLEVLQGGQLATEERFDLVPLGLWAVGPWGPRGSWTRPTWAWTA